ncbi:hypothetical protein AC578_4918 [Pseudocercospora eumusae]|uniref:Ketoreductase (KR) domain-containing protein n=1 Tax=Pseudocercospora eumusae TaxID=321146 RepID=A0A139HNN1_9PEZI|nr:hypothetical protein AC578_4918 [Pseudocercospora eumusae]
MKHRLDLFGKVSPGTFITGGSGGLGKAIAKQLAARGAHITIFARRPGPLEDAKKEILAVCASSEQEVVAVAVDLADAVQVLSPLFSRSSKDLHGSVDQAFQVQPRIPDLLYCTAGGNHAENGFFVDISAAALESCMRNNYFSSAFAAKSALAMWLKDDKEWQHGRNEEQRKRKIIFVSSAAAFACVPGSGAYSLIDASSVFKADFVSPGFIEEQKTKTPLTKRIQGVDRPLDQLQSRFPSSDKVAKLTIAAVDRGEFIICADSLAASALFTAMSGPSPKRGWGIADALFSVIVTWFAWPYLRWKWEGMCQDDGVQTGVVSKVVT